MTAAGFVGDETVRSRRAPVSLRVLDAFSSSELERERWDRVVSALGGPVYMTWDWLRTYFGGVSRFKYVRYAFSYHATENGKGTWRDTLVAGKVRVSGDIRPSKK